jgi:hypothetical protein
MKLTDYLSGVLSKFKDSRVVENVLSLVQNIIEHKSTRLWSISEDRAAFERSKRLLDGSLKSVLDAKKLSAAIREHSVAALGTEARLIVMHDPCDIRKEHTETSENLGKVRDLAGKLINGYSTFNTVATDVTGKKLYPTDITVYSNGDEQYVTVKELAAWTKGKLQPVDGERAAQIEQFVRAESHFNLARLSRAQMKAVSEAFKRENPDITLCHVLDRQFDGAGYFEFIDEELHDEFVIRLKISRNSDESELDAETDEMTAVKLRDLAFHDAQTWIIPKLQIKNKVYQEAKCLIEWDTLTLNGLSYSVVRITLTDRQRKPIHNQPMLLITNIPVYTAGHARAIYGIYLMRAKIEAVFKFLKDGLGWEDFQVRDYESVKNIIALTWFIGGYFYEIGSDLAENPAIVLIAQLGGGKGKVSRYYFLQGIKELLTHAGVVRFVKEQKISVETLGQMFAFVT